MPDTRNYAKNVTTKQRKSSGKIRRRYSRTGNQGIGGTGTWRKNPEASLKAYLASKYGEEKMKKNKDNKFDLDLEFGEIMENKLASILGSKKIEVKSERDIWKKTGNIAIELRSRNKPSGIQTTESDYWCHILTEDTIVKGIVILPTNEMKQRIKEIRGKGYGTLAKGGDDNTSVMFLLPLKELF
tara:strand:- start:99 stop:653 length:555 start_codon:yes stop_codon:yes gene_type:complete